VKCVQSCAVKCVRCGAGCAGGPGETGCCPASCAAYVLLTAQGAAGGRAVQVEPAMLLPAPLPTDCSQLGHCPGAAHG
jgi:hypothetical protein